MSTDLGSALARALGGAALRARVVAQARIELPLPPGVVPAGPGETADTTIVAVDAASVEGLGATLAPIVPGERLVVVVPPTPQSLLGQVLARARRIEPVPLERVCTALRHVGVVDVRVTHVPGRLRLAVVTGRASAP
ncbi:MAG: hypothetical protein U0234_25615 [Sandaracinus sp.]